MNQPPDPQPWQTLATEIAFRNRWVGVALDQVQLPTGQQYTYTRLEPAGVGVGVIGFNAAGEVLLEREYRHGVKAVVWQLPGGLAAPDEDLLAGALRELVEETGYAPADPIPSDVRYLGAVWDNPALGTMQSHLYAAWNLVPGDLIFTGTPDGVGAVDVGDTIRAGIDGVGTLDIQVVER